MGGETGTRERPTDRHLGAIPRRNRRALRSETKVTLMKTSLIAAAAFAACCSLLVAPALAGGDDHDPHMKAFRADGTSHEEYDAKSEDYERAGRKSGKKNTRGAPDPAGPTRPRDKKRSG